MVNVKFEEQVLRQWVSVSFYLSFSNTNVMLFCRTSSNLVRSIMQVLFIHLAIIIYQFTFSTYQLSIALYHLPIMLLGHSIHMQKAFYKTKRKHRKRVFFMRTRIIWTEPIFFWTQSRDYSGFKISERNSLQICLITWLFVYVPGPESDHKKDPFEKNLFFWGGGGGGELPEGKNVPSRSLRVKNPKASIIKSQA